VQNSTVCSLSCTPTKTHGKVFTVHFRAFAMSPGRTANPVSRSEMLEGIIIVILEIEIKPALEYLTTLYHRAMLL
jgi:hypothetical protein